MKKKAKAFILICIFILFLVNLLVILNICGFTNFKDIDSIKEKISFGGKLSPLSFIAFYTIGSVLFIPVTYLTLSGGLIFGSFWGAVYSIIAIIFGSLISFFFARIFARPFIEKFIKEKHNELYSLNLKIEHRGIFTVFFLRVLPIPAGVVNVFIGVTRIRVRDFLIGTILWMIPEAFFVAYVGGSISEFRILKMIFVFILMIFVYLGKNKIGNKAKQKIGF